MNGMDVFAFGITTAPKSIKKLAANFGFNYLDADYFIFHQANMKMLDVINRKLKLPESKVPMCMRHFGNTSSASIPLTIVTQLGKDGVINNKKFICCGFGVGLSWGTIAFVAKNMLISKLVEVDSNEHML
jgi:3-oxoacyl-[acyl-carrier-protein] synthase-3